MFNISIRGDQISRHVISATVISFKLEKFKHFLGRNNETEVWSTACSVSELFDKGNPAKGSAYASPNIGFTLPNKSDIRKQPTKQLYISFRKVTFVKARLTKSYDHGA